MLANWLARALAQDEIWITKQKLEMFAARSPR
jgi:hypothetical protein